jgi:Na+/melibiose symporter-like transporter
VILMPLTVGTALYFVPQGKTVATEPPSLASLVESLRVNKVMRLYMLITFIGGIAAGAYAALEFLYISNYLRLGERYAVIGIVQMLLTMASIPLWLAIVRRFGKHRPWAISRLGMLLVTPVVIWTSPGEGAFLPMLLMVSIVGISNGAHSVAPQAMMADVIDYDTLKTGVNRAGNYFAFVMLLSKATLAIGAGLALALVGVLGYDPRAISNESAMPGFIFAFVGMPALLGIVSTVLIYKYPIDERRQRIVRKRLEQLAERAAVAAG